MSNKIAQTSETTSSQESYGLDQVGTTTKTEAATSGDTFGLEQVTSTDLGASQSGMLSNIISIILGLVGVVSVIGSFVVWVYAIVDLIKREETKESKLLWAVLIIFIQPLGHIFYFFMEDRKKWGIWSVIFPVALVLSLIFFAIAQFMFL